jgi:membrane glycosyltransferase
MPWTGQNRDAYRVEWRDAGRALWPQTLFGLALLGTGWGLAGAGAVAWGAPMIAGLVLAIPYAVVTAAPALGRWAERTGLCALPEEIAPPDALRRLLQAEAPEPPLKPLKAA